MKKRKDLSQWKNLACLNTDFKNYRIVNLPFNFDFSLDDYDLALDLASELEITSNASMCFLICSEDSLADSGKPTAFYSETGNDWHPMQENFIVLRASDKILVGETTENKSFFLSMALTGKNLNFLSKPRLGPSMVKRYIVF